MKEIVRIKFGSHLYGTSTPDSDLDYKAVHIPDARSILLQKAERSITSSPTKAEGEKNKAGDVDVESYSLHHFFHLLASGQTGALDMLFAPEPEFTTPLWELIRMNAHKLVTKRSTAFVGYCRQQAAKYGIKGERVAAAKNAMQFFNSWLDAYGSTAKVSDTPCYQLRDAHTNIVKKETTPGHEEYYFVCCDRMVGFKNTVKEAAAIYTRVYEMYGHRAHKAETNQGIDWKAMSHAVRVATEALELMTTGKITFPLPNAAHILDIKLGRLSHAEVIEEIDQLLAKVENATETSVLREKSDQKFIDNMVADVYRQEVEGRLEI